jgi:hypothetical protein
MELVINTKPVDGEYWITIDASASGCTLSVLQGYSCCAVSTVGCSRGLSPGVAGTALETLQLSRPGKTCQRQEWGYRA